jgi:hypothetical protein
MATTTVSGDRVITGTLPQLRAIRAHWRTLAPAAAALLALGFAGQAAAVARIGDALGSARFAVPLPCVFCSTPTPVDVVIGDPYNAEPGVVICGRCSAEVDARVAALMAAPGIPA